MSKVVLDIVRKKLDTKNERIPLKGVLELTSYCNFNCVHCFVDKKHNINNLNISRIYEIIDELESMGCLFLQLTGGECTLHPDFVKIYEYIVKKGILVTVSTNGCCINDEIICSFSKYPPYKLVISLYGANEGSYRKVVGKRNKFGKVLSNLNNLKACGIIFKLNIILLKGNISCLDGMVEIANSLGVDCFIFYDLIDKLDKSSNRINRVPIDSQLYEKINKINSIYIEKKRKVTIEDRAKALNSSKGLYPCGAGHNSFQINSEGLLSICSLQQGEKLSLKDKTFRELWSELKSVREKKLKINKKCTLCKYITYCDPCPIKYNLMNSDKYMCKIAKRKYLLNKFSRHTT